MHSIGISVRRATTSDIPVILAILANPEREFRATESPEDHYDQEDLVEWIESDKSLVLLAESDGELAGMSLSAAMARSWFMLETFYILPGHRSKGIGSVLLKNTLDEMKARGSIYAFCLIHEDDPSTAGAFKMWGFEPGKPFRWFHRWL
jgi:GNAT superfamily N-acetyltransferase